MLIIHTRHSAQPNAGMIVEPELSREFADALLARDIDVDQLHVDPDGEITIETDDSRIAIGEDDGWITATLVAGDSEGPLYEGTSLTELADAVARSWRRASKG